MIELSYRIIILAYILEPYSSYDFHRNGLNQLISSKFFIVFHFSIHMKKLKPPFKLKNDDGQFSP